MICADNGWHIFIASVLVFVALNTVENLLHYNIGRTSNQEDHLFEFTPPTRNDLFRIIIIMMVFAILQGVCTTLINNLLCKK
jgi:hypothetical protein